MKQKQNKTAFIFNYGIRWERYACELLPVKYNKNEKFIKTSNLLT